jgi:hypothetical protein
MIKMTGRQLQRFSEILRAAFPLPRFDQLLLYRLGIRRPDIALGSSYEEIIFNVFTESQSRNWTLKLLQAARESNPEDPDLFAFAQEFGLATATPSAVALERIINETNISFDVVRWRTLLGQVETRVCRVEIDVSGRHIYGTGFLTGPSAVMTNYHLVEEIIHGRISPDNVGLRFDYKRLVDGTTLDAGNVFSLARKDWLIDYSEYSPLDLVADAKEVPQADMLDYAILRVEGEPGNNPVGRGEADSGAALRDWIKIPLEPYAFLPNTPLYIMQHPEGRPLQLALDTSGVIEANSNHTRIRYRTNTESGSSGSPCFNKDWELVALHHAGDPNFAALHKPQYNEGIPVSAIVALLRERGKIQELDSNLS